VLIADASHILYGCGTIGTTAINKHRLSGRRSRPSDFSHFQPSLRPTGASDLCNTRTQTHCTIIPVKSIACSAIRYLYVDVWSTLCLSVWGIGEKAGERVRLFGRDEFFLQKKISMTFMGRENLESDEYKLKDIYGGYVVRTCLFPLRPD
jgi:hypothetical protein